MKDATKHPLEQTTEARIWAEYDKAAEWCAKRGYTGRYGEPLPALISSECLCEINKDTEAFQRRVKDTAYAISMNALNLPEC